jgi:hypothetical protein
MLTEKEGKEIEILVKEFVTFFEKFRENHPFIFNVVVNRVIWRFGYILKPEERTHFLQGCILNAKVLFEDNEQHEQRCEKC